MGATGHLAQNRQCRASFFMRREEELSSSLADYMTTAWSDNFIRAYTRLNCYFCQDFGESNGFRRFDMFAYFKHRLYKVTAPKDPFIGGLTKPIVSK